jgi:hypothetical protein
MSDTFNHEGDAWASGQARREGRDRQHSVVLKVLAPRPGARILQVRRAALPRIRR